MINAGYVQQMVEEIRRLLFGTRSLGLIEQRCFVFSDFPLCIFSLPNQTYFDVINGTGAVAFSNDAKYLATLSQQSPQVKFLFLKKIHRKQKNFVLKRSCLFGIGQHKVKDLYVP